MALKTAKAETFNFDTDNKWTTGGIDCAHPDLNAGADTAVIPSGAIVTMTANELISFTSTLTVQSGGELRIATTIHADISSGGIITVNQGGLVTSVGTGYIAVKDNANAQFTLNGTMNGLVLVIMGHFDIGATGIFSGTVTHAASAGTSAWTAGAIATLSGACTINGTGAITSAAAVTLASGTLTQTNVGAFINTGTYTVAVGATHTLTAGTFNQNGTFNMAGTLTLTAGTYTPGATAIDNISGTVNQNGATFLSNATSIINLNSGAAVTIATTKFLTINGTLNLKPGSTLTQAGTGQLAIGNGGKMYIYGGTWTRAVTSIVTLTGSGKIIVMRRDGATGGAVDSTGVYPKIRWLPVPIED
jgi:hypothetical protein